MARDLEGKDREYDAAELQTLTLHFDNLLHQRVNIFLVAESIFVAAAATVWKHTVLTIGLSILALLVTLLLWRTLCRLQPALAWLIEEYKRTSQVYADYLELGVNRGRARHSVSNWIGSGAIHQWLLPGLFTLAWVVALWTSIAASATNT